jgi:3'-phosphoadenosine 5'-phosphosulfate (PAPS) 3'-phosphatase
MSIPTRSTGAYRLVRWWPDRPTEKEPVAVGTFADLAMAELIKERLEKTLPDRRFAVEAVEPWEREE